MLNYTLENPKPSIRLELSEESDGDVRLDAIKGNMRAEICRLTTEGRLVRIIGQEFKLSEMGFRIEPTLRGDLVIEVTK